MMSWQNQVLGCFGDQDVIFAGHPLDADRAKQAIKNAKTAGASKDDFEKEMVWHVYRNVKDPGMRNKLFSDQAEKLNRMW
jgi:hypothetical protein